MSWDKGFDFRATSGYVTDPTDCTYVLADAYGTVRNGVTFGWEDSISGQGRDRVNSVDPRLAGVNYQSNNNVSKRFRVDLPAAGDYDIRLAVGDAANNANNQQWEIYDGSTLLGGVGPSSINAGRWLDATGALLYSSALWVANNVAVRYTFAGTILRVKIGINASGGLTNLSHLFVSQVAGGGGGGGFQPAWARGANRMIGSLYVS